MLNKPIEYLLLDEVSTTGAGTEANVQHCRGFTYVIAASSVSTGATVKVEGYINGAWVELHAETVTADGDTVVRDLDGHYSKIRGNVTARTDGTYSVIAIGSTTGL